MTQDEYERRRRVLEEQLHADLELVRAGHQARLRALEMLWLSSPGKEGKESSRPVPSEGRDGRSPAAGETEEPSRSETPSETQEAGETRTPGEAPTATPSRPSPASPPARVFRPGSVLEEAEAALPGLPEVFDKRDLVRALGFQPHRATLLRAIDQLLLSERIAIQKHSDGRHTTKYRKPPAGRGEH